MCTCIFLSLAHLKLADIIPRFLITLKDCFAMLTFFIHLLIQQKFKDDFFSWIFILQINFSAENPLCPATQLGVFSAVWTLLSSVSFAFVFWLAPRYVPWLTPLISAPNPPWVPAEAVCICTDMEFPTPPALSLSAGGHWLASPCHLKKKTLYFLERF